jgi:hypothetical protein
VRGDFDLEGRLNAARFEAKAESMEMTEKHDSLSRCI